MSLFESLEERTSRELRDIKVNVSKKRKEQIELKEAISLLEGRTALNHAKQVLTHEFYSLEMIISKELKRYEELELELMKV